MIFPYKKINELKYVPIVPIFVQGERRWILLHAFVDSGADCSVFHEMVATTLGLQLTKGKKKVVMVGDGDNMTVYMHTVRVRFADFVFKAPIAFSSELGSGFNLLGRETFFEKFEVCFNDRNRYLRVKKLR